MMAKADGAGRQNQRHRTRKALLQAAARLMKQGHKPTLEEVAEEALVSRATAYRYFPGVDALLVEASLDVTFPHPDGLFSGLSDGDPLVRLLRADDAVQDMIMANEASLRLMLIKTLEHSLSHEASSVPVRQNRRMPLIEAALEPASKSFDQATLMKLKAALALVIGTETMIVLKDVLQLKDAKARTVRRWMIGALLAAAQQED